jgi:hypothetical protein
VLSKNAFTQEEEEEVDTKKKEDKRRIPSSFFFFLRSSFSFSLLQLELRGGRENRDDPERVGQIARQGLIGEMVPAFMAFRALGRSRVTIASPLAMTLLFTHSCTEEEATAIFFFFFFQLLESSFSCSCCLSPSPKTYLLVSPTPIQANKQTNNHAIIQFPDKQGTFFCSFF